MVRREKDVAHLRFKRPLEGERDFLVLKELWDFLTEESELPFDPPFVTKPPAGIENQLARAIYLMSVGMDEVKRQYPKRRPELKVAEDVRPRTDDTIF